MHPNARDQQSPLAKILAPMERKMTRDFARELLKLRADPDVQERISYLAERSTEGELTNEERDEYETYVHAINFVGILQSQARRVVGTPNSDG